MSKRRASAVLVGFGAGCVPALAGREVVSRVSELYHLGAGANSYLQVDHFWLLHVIVPLVSVSSFLLFLFPGAALVLAAGRTLSVPAWLVLAFGSSLLLSIGLGTMAKLVVGTPLGPTTFIYLWLASALLACGLVALRVRKEAPIHWPLSARADWRRTLWMLGMAYVGTAGLLPKIFWENFNLDGIEAFEFGRSLGVHLLPYWEVQDGVFGFYSNFLLFAYPNHWFISLFGPFEAAARLPFLLYLAVLFAALILLIEWASRRALSGSEEAVVWLGLALYAVVQAFNTNYEPFFADLAEMAATDTLWVLCFLSACYALWTSRFGWFGVFALMTYAASPGGMLLLAALALMTYFGRSPQRLERLRAVAGVMAVCLLIGLIYEIFYHPLALGEVNNQFSAKNMLRRLYPPNLTEFIRINALLFPSGLLPALCLVVVRRKDELAWTVAGITLLYFGVIYAQAWTSLHQFTPVMVLPLLVFWRLYLSLSSRAQRWFLPAVTATTALSLFLSLPRHFEINQAIREFGRSTSYRIGDYERAYEQAARSGSSLYALVPEDYRLQYPNQSWGADPYSWIYYATREKPPGTFINYVVQESSRVPPRGFTKVNSDNGVSVYVADLERWRRDRERDLPKVVVSPLYDPILRRTFHFSRLYVERVQREAKQQPRGAKPIA